MENLDGQFDDTIQKESIPYYQYSEFENVKLISRNVYEAIFKTSQKTISLKCVSLNDKSTLDNLINEIKRYRKLEIHDNILKFYGITKQENTNNYMIILEYANEGSLRQYLKTNIQKLDWNAKLNLVQQIANILMFLHSNDIREKFNSESILIHNGIIKFNVFGLTKTISDSLRFLINNLRPIQYMDPQYLELFSTIGDKSSDILGLGIILWEISSDCWKRDGNLRPDVSQIVKNLSKIIFSDASAELETPQSEPYNVMDEVISVQLEKLNIQNEETEIKPGPPFINVTNEINDFINELFGILIDTRKKQIIKMQPIIIKNYIRERKQNPVKILYEMIHHPFYYLFTCLIGFFYLCGIGTAVDYQMAFKFFSLAFNEIIDTSSSNSSSLMKLYNINKENCTMSLAYMYLNGLGVEKDEKKAFQIYSKVADEGSFIAVNTVAYCYEFGLGVEKNEEKAFEKYLKSAERGNIVAHSNVSGCYYNGIGITEDLTKSFKWDKKSALAGNINALYNVGWSYERGIGVDKDEKEALKWYLEAAEKGYSLAQYELGIYYANDYGINNNRVKAFEQFKKAAENDDADGQYRLGKCFYEGYGTKKDIINAICWLNKANENGNADANELLEEIISNIM
ncbi:hypothetical protein Glove_140g82 [Diversispora epigaea]|uniref:Protein kinase domain-containing protein n=1 Tax=Diversispora epigaea TaxID=1348612 RepID=A0A397J462_9GLOM|nr:hypothetical protein Glove_140g82 [Diversispora epigaea]